MHGFFSLLRILGRSDPYAVANLNRPGNGYRLPVGYSKRYADLYADAFGDCDPLTVTDSDLDRLALRLALGRHARPGAIQRHHRLPGRVDRRGLRNTGCPVAEAVT